MAQGKMLGTWEVLAKRIFREVLDKRKKRGEGKGKKTDFDSLPTIA